MKVLIITEEDVFYVYEFFKNLFPLAETAPYTVTALTILPPFNRSRSFDLAKQMYGFYGLRHFLIVAAHYCARRISGKTVRNLAVAHHIGFLPTQNVNDPAYIQAIKDRGVDLLVSVAAPQRFGKELLQATPRGCINVHSALLPENRGMMPLFWAMFKGDSHTGVTVHYMEEKFDQGAVIKQERVRIGDESLDTMIMKTKRIGATLLHDTLNEIVNNQSNAVPMPSGGCYQSFPTPQDVKEFRRRGKRIR